MYKEQRKRRGAEEESTQGASSSSSISPEATGLRTGQYDVFLNFRGSDTRKTFTDHLYQNLVKAGTVPFCVFRDENSIPIGEEFGSEILDAIVRSKISIPVISENYASSKWCLYELVHIMEYKKSTSHIVLPIFYKVAPSDVRHLKGNFGNAFRLSRKCFDKKDIREWQRALNEVSYLHGWESDKFEDGYEGKLVEHVVETVISKLQEDFQLNVPEQLVGLDNCLKKIMNWIDSPSINARMIGIYGMGGIGKTTLAKAIHNQLKNKFVHVSFLPNVQESTKRHGITYLQSQLISDILQSKNEVSSIDDGINIIKSRFKGKKVLILLDDIDDKNQLDALARERNWFMVGSLIIVTTRNEAVLDQSKFKVDYKYELNGLGKVHALLLFNRHAFRMDHSLKDFDGISRDIISTMGGLPLALEVVGSYLYKKKSKGVWEDVWKQLKNQPHRDVKKILQISYDALEDGHKQIFLDIVCFFIGERSEYPMYMWEDCGLYPSQGIEELKLRRLIKIDDGKFEVHDQLRDLGRSIFCEGQPPEKRSGPWDDNYEGIPKVLRTRERRRPWFHDFLGATSTGRVKQLLSEVRWLEWMPLKSDASLSTTILHLFTTELHKLSVLELVYGITEEGWSQFMVSKRLKVLKLSECPNLRCTPDFSAFPQLKILELYNCEKLEHLHSSIGKLTSLVSLSLSLCGSLKKLPDEVGELKDLEKLSLYGSGITEIPTSIASLRKLKTLRTAFCWSLREIPSSIGDLQNLQHLLLSCSSIKEIPSAIGRLKNLRTLGLSSCYGLEGAIPSEIGELPSLEYLDLSNTPIFDLPESVRNLSSLQHLYLTGYKELWSLPQLPLGLMYLSISCQCSRLPKLSSLIHLEELHLKACPLLESIPELSSRLLRLCVEECDKLILLKLDGCMYLEGFSIRECSSIERLYLSRLVRLKRLHANDCDNLVEIQGYDNLESLEVIFIYNCNSIERLLCPELRLKILAVVRCNNMVEIQGFDSPKFLEELDFTGCSSMETLPNLMGCEKLRSLRVQNCKKLTQLRGLEKLGLSNLDIFGCDSLEALPKLSRTRVSRDYKEYLDLDSWSDSFLEEVNLKRKHQQ